MSIFSIINTIKSKILSMFMSADINSTTNNFFWDNWIEDWNRFNIFEILNEWKLIGKIFNEALFTIIQIMTHNSQVFQS